MQTPDVSIIFVNYNTSALINDCVRTILDKVVDITYEIIVVDNNTEQLDKVIEAAGDQRVHLQQLPDNVGFGLANNAGAGIARGRNLFILNPDTLLVNNAVKILSDYLDTHPDTGICGGNLYDAELKPNHSLNHLTPGLFWELDDLFRNLPVKIVYGKGAYFNHSGNPIEVPFITGADIMIRADLFRELGGFSSDFFMYYEDADLCRRVIKAGYRIASVPAARIIHLEGGSANFNQVNPVTLNYDEQGRITYLRRHTSRLHRWASNTIHISIYALGRALTRNPFFSYKLRSAVNAIFHPSPRSAEKKKS
ncbi:MAG: glycosyltransferase family 2 protein [Duncaniella sp.]|nr:glycosyltransferase family 2 protein [Duncaniella sp.]